MSIAAILLLLFAANPQDGVPEGALTLFAGNDTAANFLVGDSIRKEGDLRAVEVFTVYSSSVAVPGGEIVQQVSSYEVTCSTRRVRIAWSAGYDAAGAERVRLEPEEWEAIEPRSTADRIGQLLCDGAQLPPTNTVRGSAAAREAARIAIQRPG